MTMAAHSEGGRAEELKTQFLTREGSYTLISSPDYSRPKGATYGPQGCGPVCVSFVTVRDAEPNNARERLCFSVGKELYFYVYKGVHKSCGPTLPIDKRLYKGTTPTCHDCNELTASTVSCALLVGFSAGQVQLLDPMGRESNKLFNEERTIDKTRVTCVKWVPASKNFFLASHASGCLYAYNTELGCCGGSGMPPPSFHTVCTGEGYMVQTCRYVTSVPGRSPTTSSTQPRTNPLYKWTIGEGAVNAFRFSPCARYLAVVGQDGCMRVFEYSTMRLVGMMRSYFGGLHCVAWSPDSKYIATGGEDDLVTVYSFDEHRVLCRGRGHQSWVVSVAFDPFACTEQLLTDSGCDQRKQADPCVLPTADKGGTDAVASEAHGSGWSLKGNAAVCSSANSQMTSDHQQADRNGSEKPAGSNPVLSEVQSDGMQARNSKPELVSAPLRPSTNTGELFASGAAAGPDAHGEHKNGSAESPDQQLSAASTYQRSWSGDVNAVTSEGAEKKCLESFHRRSPPFPRTSSDVSRYSLHAGCNSPSKDCSRNAAYRLGSVGQDTLLCLWDLNEDSLREHGCAGKAGSVTSSPAVKDERSGLHGGYIHSEAAATGKHSPSNVVHPAGALGPDTVSSTTNHSAKPLQQILLPASHNHQHSIQSTHSAPGGLMSLRISTSKYATLPSEASSRSKPGSIGAASPRSTSSSGKKEHKRNLSLMAGRFGHDRHHLGTLKSSIRSAQTGHSSVASQCLLGSAECPRLSDVPIIEPHTCKKVANEMLSCIHFLRDCIVTASHDGNICSWARPGRTSMLRTSQTNTNLVNGDKFGEPLEQQGERQAHELKQHLHRIPPPGHQCNGETVGATCL